MVRNKHLDFLHHARKEHENMYTRISGVRWWLLDLVTFHIYSYVLLHRITKNLNQMGEVVNEKKIMDFVPAFFLGYVTCHIFHYVWSCKFFILISHLNAKKDATITPANGFLICLLALVPVYRFFWMANVYNKLAYAFED